MILFRRLLHTRLSRNIFTTAKGSSGIPQRAFAAGVACAALTGYAIGVGLPTFFYNEFSASFPDRSKAFDGPSIQGATQEEMAQAYKLITPIAHGGSATVWRAIDVATGRTVAIKVINKTLVNTSTIKREVDALRRCASCPHVTSLLAVFDVAGDDVYAEGEWFVVMELAEGGEILEWAQGHPMFTERVASRLVQQAATALRHLHACGIVHRDVKPENLVLSTKDAEATLKLVDFGAAACCDAGAVEGKAGTWTYWAPEQAKGQPHDKAVDMWGLGVVLCILLSGRHPFQKIFESTRTLDDKGTLEAIVKGQYSLDSQEWSGISESARDLLEQLLVYEPEKRLSADQLLAHPWVRGQDVPEDPLQWWLNSLSFHRRLRLWGVRGRNGTHQPANS